MKFIAEKYRMLSIWLSLIILSMAFVVGSDKSCRNVCIPAVFFMGTLLYLLGGIREWVKGRRVGILAELLLSACMLTCTVLSLLRLGGIL